MSMPIDSASSQARADADRRTLASCKTRALAGTLRGPFLLLTPVCVFLGLTLALGAGTGVDWLAVSLVLSGAMAGHISVNVLNEYYDFISGLDQRTQRTPFSGGSGSLPACPEAAPSARVLGYLSLLIAVLIGAYLVTYAGTGLLPLGVGGILLIAAYTPWITRSPWLSLFAPGFGFGTLMVLGSFFVFSHQYSFPALAASFIPFLLVNNLLLLNQFPDVEADRSVGRCNLPIRWGRASTRWVYLGFLAGAYLWVIAAIVLGILPASALIALLTLLLAIPAAFKVVRYYDDLQRLAPALAMNVAICLVTTLLLGIGLLLG